MGQKLDQSQKVGSLRIQNNTSHPARYQVVVDQWVLDESGNRVAKESSDIRFFPATVFELAPGQTQTLRWQRLTIEPEEQVYLIKVQETPRITAPSPSAVALIPTPRFEVLWTFTPAGSEPSLRAKRDGNFLILHNEGTATARVRDISYPGVSGGTYVLLPGESVRLQAAGTSSHVRLVSNKVPVTLSVD